MSDQHLNRKRVHEIVDHLLDGGGVIDKVDLDDIFKGEVLYFAILATETWGSYDGMIAVLDTNNKLLSLPGSINLPDYSGKIVNKPKYDGNSFLNPHDVCIDEDDNIYVPQWYSGMTYPFRLIRV